jgi:exodeoxyribonuclease VII small subunit
MTGPEVNSLDYEAAVTELEKTVQLLGKEQDDLAESVRIYERGLALARRCSALLKDADRRLGELAPIKDRAPTP